MVIDPGNNLNSTNAAASGSAKSRLATTQKTAVPPSESDSSSAPDSVSLSQKGQTLAKLASELSGDAEINHDKIAQVRAALANGSYQVDAQAIADSMLEQDGSFK